MQSTARAAVATVPRTTELQDLPVPTIGPEEGLLAVEACGVCGTDWEVYERESLGAGLGPLVLGHETVGRIAAIGDEAAWRWGVSEGDRVAVEEFLPCGRCGLCRAGQYRICDRTDLRRSKPFLRYGATPVDLAPGLWGGFSEVMYLHPDAIVYRVPEGVSAELATLFVAIGNGIRWVVQEADGGPGQSLAVFGPGQHGLGCVVAARHAGMGPIAVFGTERDERRLELARTLGADVAVDTRTDPAEVAADLTGMDGFDVVVDVTPGAAEVVSTAMSIATKRGRVVLAGGKGGRATSTFSNDLVLRQELRILGVRGHDRRSVVPALDLIASDADRLAALCTHSYPLEETGEALATFGERTDPSAIHLTVVVERD